ncbi:hypothetical protein AYO38_10235 [bacterium SCGC AG-212-C10]|nr:hypothetical protein AYO38_10235 [bacterium SCGC AG-212-C10]
MKRPGPLYAWPMMFTANMPGVALGIARGALDEVLEIARNKRGMDGSKLSDEPWLHSELAKTDAAVRSVRALILATLEEIWETLLRGEHVPRELSARFRGAMTYCFDVCCTAVDDLYRAVGSSALYVARSSLDRRLRDIHTVRQHIVLSPKTYESAGRVMLGLPVQQALF